MLFSVVSVRAKARQNAASSPAAQHRSKRFLGILFPFGFAAVSMRRAGGEYPD